MIELNDIDFSYGYHWRIGVIMALELFSEPGHRYPVTNYKPRGPEPRPPVESTQPEMRL